MILDIIILNIKRKNHVEQLMVYKNLYSYTYFYVCISLSNYKLDISMTSCPSLVYLNT